MTDVKHTPVRTALCPCGHPSCKRYTLSNGVFHQGNGFDAETAERYASLWNALEGIPDPTAFMEQHKKLVEAAEALRNAVCGETGFASAVRLNSGSAYPWPALDIAEEKLNAAIAALKGEA